MIYRETPKFIFVHVPKTGGTSIEAILSKLLLGKDLRELSNAEAFRYVLPDRSFTVPAQNTRHHFALADYQRHCGADLPKFFTFAVVRNPWDLVVSEIMFFRRKERFTFNQRTFKESIRKLLTFEGVLWGHRFKPQIEYLWDISQKPAVNYVARFEELQIGFDEICGKLALPKTQLPAMNVTSRGRPHYSEFYDPESKAWVAKHFSPDIEEFGYTF